MRENGTAGPVSPPVIAVNSAAGKIVTPSSVTAVIRTGGPSKGRVDAIGGGSIPSVDTEGGDGGRMRGIGEPCGTGLVRMDCGVCAWPAFAQTTKPAAKAIRAKLSSDARQNSPPHDRNILLP